MERETPDPMTSPDSATPDPVPGRRVRHTGIVATVVVCILLALFAVLLVRGPGGSQTSLSSGPTVPATWKTYRDLANLFTVRLPASWSVRLHTVAATFGDRTGSVTETQEYITFSDPAQGSASAEIFVTAIPIQSDFERHWYCEGNRTGERDSFHNYPATTMPATWLFESATAHFQLGYMIPGVIGPVYSSPPMLTPVPTPTSLPQATIDHDKTIVETILASFQPASASPLSC